MTPRPKGRWLTRRMAAPALMTAILRTGLLSFCSGCATHMPQHCHDDKAHFSPEYFKQEMDKNFTWAWDANGELPVYRCTVPADNPVRGATAAQRPVLLLHEYDRLSGSTLDFAKRLSAQGFTVYVPLLFGRAEGGRGGWPFVRNTLELIFSPQWNVALGVDEHQPITDRLERVCWRISNLTPHRHRGVAVIGMCLTGAFPIALLDQKCVIGAVLAQPSAPFFWVLPGAKQTPGVSAQDLQLAATRARDDDIDVFWTRYEEDTIAQDAKFGPIRAAFGTHLQDHTIKLTLKEREKWGLTKHAHATLTLCFNDNPSPDYPPRVLFKDLLTYLNGQFQRHGALGAGDRHTRSRVANAD